MNAWRSLLSLCAPLPALIIGLLTMRELDVPMSMRAMNVAAVAVGVLIFAVMRRLRPPAWSFMAIAGLAAILLTFAFKGVDGVHRWIFIGNFALHASAVVAPVLIACVAMAPRRYLMIVIAVATAGVLALQPDAAQTCAFSAACAVILFREWKSESLKLAVGLVALIACAVVSLVQPDPLKAVPHVEGIFEAVRGKALAAFALLLLPIPFFVAWTRFRQSVPLALGVYMAMVTIAFTWGTFPVPVMGYGVSPILGYYIALALSATPTSASIS